MSEALTVAAQTILTDAGRNALRDAELNGTPATPKFFRASDQEYALDPTMQAAAFSGWYSHDINAYLPVEDQTAQFTCSIPEASATHSLRSVGIFMADGTLFGLSVLTHEIPPHVATNLHILHDWDNINQLLDFRYLPIAELELELTVLDNALRCGLEVLASTRVKFTQGETVS